jgi:hypothetical protein
MEALMLVKKICLSVTTYCTAILVFSVPVEANDDWRQSSFEVAGDGELIFEYPVSWGKKPQYEMVDSIAQIRFGPYGPKSKPVFLVSLVAVVALEPVGKEDLLLITKDEIENFKNSAFETEFPISDLAGPNAVGHYFSISDRERKRGEFDYLTMAVVTSNHLLVKCFFFSSDGAPDFGPDAVQMMQSIRYVVPEPEEEKD